ncbi:non-ribosomal peptide synthetase [Paenibacillus tengchongensis]|uniref:non-ribosomal peptide synthetase n=1 Tax=Paenibacillus tengchongensis TaxID=2608684 RepID=UPI00124F4E44|nr:non-ribosomal peptide synthetase [Paenibacillus tengchongensis]
MQKLLPLTHPQKRIYYSKEISSNPSLHNIGGVIRIKGSVELDRLEHAIKRFIQKNENTRTRIFKQNNEMFQHIGYYDVPKIDYFDFSGFGEAESLFDDWVQKEASKPFSIENDILFYIAMFRISLGETGYFVKFHHIIADGWSLQLLTHQIHTLYEENSKERLLIDDVSYSYINYYEREKKYLASARYERDKVFWKEKLKDLPEVFLKYSSDDFTGNRETFKLDSLLSNQIRTFVRSHNISMNIFFVSVFLMYLYKTTEAEDIIIGTPVINRSGKKEKDTFGMFTSSMPFRTAIYGKESFKDLIVRIQKEMTNYFIHQKYPYDLLVHDLDLKKQGYDNLFNLCVNYYNTTHPKSIEGKSVENHEFYNGSQLYALQFVIKDWDCSGALTLDFDYKVKDYTRQEVVQMFRNINHLMQELMINPGTELELIPVISDEESRELLLDLNNTFAAYPKGRTTIQIIEAQVDKTPNKIAVLLEQQGFTYLELNQRANQVAWYLQSRGITRGDIVGVMTNPSVEMIIAILGVMKAGATYLPIDTSYPQERISYIIKDSGISLLIMDEYDASFDFAGEIINVHNKNLMNEDTSNLGIISHPDDLAYVMYTSGSTGNPKGVMVKNRGLLNYLCWAEKTYIKNELEIFPLYSSLSFDLTVTSLFTPLISGHQIVIYQQDPSEFILHKIFRKNLATIIKLTPAHLSLIKNYDFRSSSIKRIIVGGEDLKMDLARAVYEIFNADIEIYNEYGPTETVVGCTVHKYNYQTDNRISVPIGRPAHNVQLYVLDRLLKPLPKYSVGELYIAGEGVAEGYLNNPELTAEKFIVNPFTPGGKMYKTGDYVRLVDEGVLEYKGRIDQQIKLRGYRIELGEIEQNLMRIEGINEATVIIYEKDNNKNLCAYVTCSHPIHELNIRRELASSIPSYMIPDYIVQLDYIPLDHNGKINRNQLPHPKIPMEIEDQHTALNKETEVLICVLKEILQNSSIQANHNFYHLGGDSIKAIQITSSLLDKGYHLSVKDILANPIILNMAMLIRQENRYVSNSGTSIGTVKHTPITKWFFGQRFENLNYYNQSVLLRINAEITLTQLNEIMVYIVDHHDALRLNYNQKEQILYYQNDYLQSFKMDLDHFGNEPFELMPIIAGKLKASLDITNGLLFKAAPFKTETGDMYLLLIAHHLITDGISWRILLEDISLLLKQTINRMSLSLPAKTASYQEWAEFLYGKRDEMEEREREYLDSIYADRPIYKKWEITSENALENAKKVSLLLSEVYTKKLLTTANYAFNTHANELMIIGTALAAIDSYEGKREIVIEIEGHGREMLDAKLDLSRTVGWFTTMYPVVLKTEATGDLTIVLKRWKDQLRSVPMNGVGFDMFSNHCMSQTNNEVYMAEIRFNYMGEFDTAFKSQYIDWSHIWTGPDIDLKNHLTAEMDIISMVVKDQLRFEITYNSTLYSDDFITGFVQNLENRLKEIVDHCHQTTHVNYTPSDFDAAEISQEELDSLFL